MIDELNPYIFAMHIIESLSCHEDILFICPVIDKVITQYVQDATFKINNTTIATGTSEYINKFAPTKSRSVEITDINNLDKNRKFDKYFVISEDYKKYVDTLVYDLGIAPSLIKVTRSFTSGQGDVFYSRDHTIITLMWILESFARNERIMIISPAVDSNILNVLMSTNISTNGSVLACEQESFIGKCLGTSDSGSIPVIDSRKISADDKYDRYYILTTNKPAEYALKLVKEMNVNPAVITIQQSVFSLEENNIYKEDNKYSEISSLIKIEGSLNGLTSRALVAHIYDCVKHIASNNIKGDIVNLGVYRGWSMKYFLLLLEHFGLSDRTVIGFDTFDGFTQGGELDVYYNIGGYDGFRGISTDIVNANLAPFKNYRLVKGDIVETIKDVSFPNGISLALFDMDDYTPTMAALPAVHANTNPGGFIVHDHYNMMSCPENLTCVGQRLAMDEFLKTNYMFNLSGTNIFIKQ